MTTLYREAYRFLHNRGEPAFRAAYGPTTAQQMLDEWAAQGLTKSRTMVTAEVIDGKLTTVRRRTVRTFARYAK